MQPHSLCIAIADKLRERILAHQIPPGSDVSDGALAQELGVSRTPVREAMKLLCHEGLLTAHARRGMTVTELSAQQVDEARQLCSLLARRLQQLEHETPNLCSELTLTMYRLAQSRLQLSLGSGFDAPSATSEKKEAGATAAISAAAHCVPSLVVETRH